MERVVHEDDPTNTDERERYGFSIPDLTACQRFILPNGGLLGTTPSPEDPFQHDGSTVPHWRLDPSTATAGNGQQCTWSANEWVIGGTHKLVSFELPPGGFQVLGHRPEVGFAPGGTVSLACPSVSDCGACGTLPAVPPVKSPGLLTPPVLFDARCLREGVVVDESIVGALEGIPYPDAACSTTEPPGDLWYAVLQTTPDGKLRPHCTGSASPAGGTSVAVTADPTGPTGTPAWVVISHAGWHDATFDPATNALAGFSREARTAPAPAPAK